MPSIEVVLSKIPIVDRIVRDNPVFDKLLRQSLVARLVLGEDLKEGFEQHQGVPKARLGKHAFRLHILELKKLTCECSHGSGIGWHPKDSHLPLGPHGLCQVRHSPFGRYTVLSCDEVETLNRPQWTLQHVADCTDHVHCHACDCSLDMDCNVTRCGHAMQLMPKLHECSHSACN